jgi:hypothetical protein
MPFFPTVTVEAAQVGQSPQLLTRLRHREIDGIVVKNVYDRATCEALRIALEAGHPRSHQDRISSQIRRLLLRHQS